MFEIFSLDEVSVLWEKPFVTGPLFTFDVMHRVQCFKDSGVLVIWDQHPPITRFLDPENNILSSMELDLFRPQWDQSYSHSESILCIPRTTKEKVEALQMAKEQTESILLCPGLDVNRKRILMLMKVPTALQDESLSLILFPDSCEKMMIVGSCNGVVCLSDYPEMRVVVLWNPMLQEYISINFPPPKKHDMSFFKAVGLGYDYSTQQFKIVTLVAQESPPFYSRVQVYAPSVGSWKDIAVLPVCVTQRNCSVIVKGVPYWAAVDDTLVGRLLISFDPVTEKCRTFVFPLKEVKQYFPDDTSDEVHFVNLKDRVAAMLTFLDGSFKETVAIFKLDENTGVWEKIFTTKPLNVEFNLVCNVQCYKDSGEVLNSGWSPTSTVVHNPRKNTIVRFVDLDCFTPQWEQSYPYMETLLSIQGSIPIVVDLNQEHAG